MSDAPRVEDVTGTASRMNWGAVFAGALIALACNLILTLFLGAVGLSLTDAGVRTGTAAIVAIVCGVIGMAASLFLGGWVTTQLVVGETKGESCIHGTLTWVVYMALSLALIGVGMRSGYNALLGATLVAQNSAGVSGQTWEEAARAAGISQERIDQLKAGMDPNRAREAANDPAVRERVADGAMVASWATLLGTVLSLCAVVAGALVGRGPTYRLIPTGVRVSRREVIVTQ